MWAVALTNKSHFAFVTFDYCIGLAVHRHVAGASFKRKRKQSSKAQRKTRKAVAFDSWLASSLHIARQESLRWIMDMEGKTFAHAALLQPYGSEPPSLPSAQLTYLSRAPACVAVESGVLDL